jgi:hypothetical protein
MNFIKYLDDIKLCNKPDTVVYIGIGSAANNVIYNNQDYGTLDISCNHEYPMFLKNIKKKYPTCALYIFLIDPYLENPPYIVTNGYKNQLASNVTKLNNEVYIVDDNTIVYAINQYMDSPCETNSINSFYNILNNYAKEYLWLVFVCEYTGTSTRELALHYERDLIGHLDHIIYGFYIDDSTISSCLMPVDQPICQYISSRKENGQIIVFNVACYNSNYNTEFSDILLVKRSKEENNIIIQQIILFLKLKCKYIRSNIFMMYCHICRCIQNKRDINEWNLKILKTISLSYDINYLDRYEIIRDKLKDIFINELSIYISIIYVEDSKTIVQQRFNQLINESDTYKFDKYFADLYIKYDDFFYVI